MMNTSLDSSGGSTMSTGSMSTSSFSTSSFSNSTNSSGAAFNSVMVFDDDELKKKKIRQMQNRQSAAQYRERKKEYLEKLESIVDNLENDRNQLLQQTKQLNMMQNENFVKISLLEEQIEAALRENQDLKSKLSNLTQQLGNSNDSTNSPVISPNASFNNNTTNINNSNGSNSSSSSGNTNRRSRFNIGENRNILNADPNKMSEDDNDPPNINSNNNSIGSILENNNNSNNSNNNNNSSSSPFSLYSSPNASPALAKRQREFPSLFNETNIRNNQTANSNGQIPTQSPSSYPLPHQFSSSFNNNTSFTPPLASFSSILSIASPTSSPLISSLSSSPNFNQSLSSNIGGGNSNFVDQNQSSNEPFVPSSTLSPTRKYKFHHPKPVM
ncbi:hypothetical protein CYY_009442 [Polysphondylium violaceum]|uniref:BZIP domain-containing protein n=1 Tax=Polysphondylium violaceum TaxID=133409 RepID=A0A8J4V0I2_9MYCE|nr:hypothetical protein CYY_009442 [Polysphondylium violaceum]